jgi:hypothetical protein
MSAADLPQIRSLTGWQKVQRHRGNYLLDEGMLLAARLESGLSTNGYWAAAHKKSLGTGANKIATL